MQGSLKFNGISSDDFQFKMIVDQPIVRFAKRKVTTTNISGMNGNRYDFEDAWEEKIIDYKVLAGTEEATNYETFIEIMEWLNSADGYAILTDSFDTNHYHLAVCIDGTDAVMNLQHYGKATLRFHCKPERFLIQEPQDVESGDVINNPTNHVALPKITLTGGGTRSLFQMAGRTLTPVELEFTSQELFTLVPNKDTTAWMVKPWQGNNNVVTFSGAYRGTINSLTEGALNYEINGNSYNDNWGVGFVLAVQPNTDYTLSWEAYNNGRVGVWFANKSGYNDITGSVYKETATGGWVSDQLTFHTPDGCGYVLISLGHIKQTTPGKTTQQYRNVMLATGTEAKPFRAYDTPSESSIAINDTILTITSSGIGTAVIDCEKENVTVDGANGNPISKVTDAYGNLSVSYLQFVAGVNTLTYSGDITAVSVEPRFWTL